MNNLNLLELATKAMEKFDVTKDIVSDFEEIEDGEYMCVIESIAHKFNEKGTNWLNMDCTLLDTNDNRHIFIPYFFTEKTTERSVRKINKLAYEMGYEIPLEAYASFDRLAGLLNGLAGSKVLVNKKTSNNGFVNYSVKGINEFDTPAVQQAPVQQPVPVQAIQQPVQQPVQQGLLNSVVNNGQSEMPWE